MGLNLESVAKSLFKIIPESLWQGKSADDIESSLQQLVQGLGNLVLGSHLLPQPIADCAEGAKQHYVLRRARRSLIERAVQRGEIRCAQCQGLYRPHKRDEKIRLKTLFGETVQISRTRYYCAVCDAYACMADRSLELVSHALTPRLALLAALCGASWSYEVGSAFLGFFPGARLSASAVRAVTIDSGLRPDPLPEEPLAKPPGVVGVAGVLIRGQEKDQWWEMKGASFFSHLVPVSQGRCGTLAASRRPSRRRLSRKTDWRRLAPFVAGAMQGWKDFAAPVTQEAERRGLDRREPIEFIGDGGEGIRTLQETVFPYAQTRLDQYQGQHKIYQRTDQAYQDNRAKSKQQKKLLTCFAKGQVDQAIQYMRNPMPRDAYKKQAAHKLMGYLARHQEHIPNYQTLKKKGGHGSSGLTEKANDLVVVRRLKDPVMHGTRDGAAPLLQHRTAFINRNARGRSTPYDVAFGHGVVQ